MTVNLEIKSRKSPTKLLKSFRKTMSDFLAWDEETINYRQTCKKDFPSFWIDVFFNKIERYIVATVKKV